MQVVLLTAAALLLRPSAALPAYVEGSSDYSVNLQTSSGPIELQVHGDWSPEGGKRFRELVESGFFNNVKFFRAVENFMVQFGISGDPSVSAHWRDASIPDDPSAGISNARGTVSFAKAGPDSRTTQVFINLRDNSYLDGMGFTPFAKVVRGMENVDGLFKGYGEETMQHNGEMQQEGNTYLEREFPNLSTLYSASIAGTPAAMQQQPQQMLPPQQWGQQPMQQQMYQQQMQQQPQQQQQPSDMMTNLMQAMQPQGNVWNQFNLPADVKNQGMQQFQKFLAMFADPQQQKAMASARQPDFMSLLQGEQGGMPGGGAGRGQQIGNGISLEVQQPGDGRTAPQPGQTVSVHYTGTLQNGQKFDSSLDRGEPIQFALGQGQVIKCWDAGIAKMTVGEKATLTCPPDVAYGANGTPDGTIPPGATLNFDVQLMGVQ